MYVYKASSRDFGPSDQPHVAKEALLEFGALFLQLEQPYN